MEDFFGSLRVSLRLGLQILTALGVVYGVGGFSRIPLPSPFDLPLSFLGIPFSLLWLVGVTNVFNFLDGIDGLAATQAMLAGLAISLLGDPQSSCLGLAIAGACSGFLIHNWHPAKVFMGDTGSYPIGFMLAAIPFQGLPQRRHETALVMILCLWFFLADGLYTIVRRALRGEKIWEAHRSHLYQRLVITGLRHDQVTLAVGAATTVLSFSVVLASKLRNAFLNWVLIGVALIAFVSYACWTIWREGICTKRDLA
jgi:UDP-N-acetylmuramyl pentapeptide phosphotransferase/UDP-N-acetylglucosamine-1-phosphate transferase